jgi:glycosyltransferase involved in cell wall biosynthesis
MGVPVVNTLHDHWLLCPNNMLYRRDGSFCDPAQTPMGCRNCFRKYDFWGDIPFRRPVFAAMTSNVKFFISPSQALMRLHVSAGYSEDRFRLVPHGLDSEVRNQGTIHPAVQEVIASRDQYRTLVFAGGGIEIKGAEVLLEAIPLLLRYIDRLRIVVAGTGESRLQARFRQHVPPVRVLGWVPFHDMGRLFAAADLVLVPSTCPESFSLVTLESLQLGTPVVGSAFGGIPELILEGETGYLFPVGDAVALAERVILHFARSAYARRRMRHRCTEQVSADLTLGNHIQGILQVYREALGN